METINQPLTPEKILEALQALNTAYYRLEYLKQQYEKDTGNPITIDDLNELQYRSQDNTMPDKQS